MALSKEDARRFVEGQRVLNALGREEVWRRLATLSIEEAREEYDGLCRLWEFNSTRDDLGDLDRARLDELMTLRQRLDLIARRYLNR